LPDDGAPQEREERYHYLVELASDIILLYDLDTRRLLEGNLAFYRLLGYSIEDIAGLSIYDIVAHDRESIDGNIEKAKKTKYCFVGQRKYRKKDGSLLDVDVSVNLFFLEGKGILCSIARDITERKLAEEAMSKSEQEKAAILDGLKTVSVEYLDPQMRIVWLNSAVQKHLDLSEDKIKGKRCFEVIQGLESPCPGCTALKALQTDKSQEGKLVTPDGKVWISHSNIIKDANGDLAGVVHVAVNITERKRAEIELHLQNEIMANMVEGVILTRVSDATIVYTNQKFEEMFGYSKGELVGKNISVVNAPAEKSPEEIAEDIQCSLKKIGAWSGEVHNIKKDGTLFGSQANVSTFNHPDYGPVWVATHEDITERKRAEKELKESENLYRAIFENTGTATMIIEDNTIVSLANSGLERLSGYSKEEIEGKKSWTEFVVKEDLERMLQQHRLRRVDPSAALNDYEFRAIDRNGIVKDILLRVGIIPGTKQSVASLLDITNRKQMEEALRESREQYRKPS